MTDTSRLQELEAKIANQAHELEHLNRALREKNVALDAMQIAGINLVVVNATAFVALVWARMHSTPTANPTLAAGTQVNVIQPGDTPNTLTTV